MAVPELVALLNTASPTPPKTPELALEPRNPYKGLRAFTGDDAHDFFGRDSLINELNALPAVAPTHAGAPNLRAADGYP
jgi:hypothetical protein